MIDKIEKDLLELKDDKYKAFQEKLGLSNLNMIGIRMPLLRKYAKTLLKQDYLIYLNNPSNKYFETVLLEGILIASSNLEIEEKIAFLDKYIPKINNWATCDTVCNSFKLKDYELSSMFNYLKQYKDSKKEFTLRFIIVMMLNYYLNDEYIDKVLDIINNINVDYYYTNMAISWLLSYVYIIDKIKFNTFINKTNLSNDIKKKTYKKIIESNQVSCEDKNIIKEIIKKL